MSNLESVPVTQTKAGATRREIAVAVIAEKLGIPVDQVRNDTPLGDVAHEITMVIAFKTGDVIIGNARMSAGEVFKQLT